METGALTAEKNSSFKITGLKSLQALGAILKQNHSSTKDMIQVLWDADTRSDFAKVYDLARSEKVSVEMLDSLPIVIDSKDIKLNEAIPSVKGSVGIEKVIETIKQGNLKVFSLFLWKQER